MKEGLIDTKKMKISYMSLLISCEHCQKDQFTFTLKIQRIKKFLALFNIKGLFIKFINLSLDETNNVDVKKL